MTPPTPKNPVFDLAVELMQRESVTPADAGCQGLIGERLAGAGMQVEELRVGEVDNLLASHGQGGPHVMLLGHTDVVPPGPLAAWTSPPFAPEVRNGLLFGRGAADMKGSVAAFVVALENFLARHPDHPGTVSLLLTSDEEGPARDGVRAVVPMLRDQGRLPDACLVGEPSSVEHLGDNARIGRRGSIQAKLVVRGTQGHTAYAHPADNPVHRAGPLIAALGALNFDDGDEHFPPTRLQISNINAGTGADNVTPGELTLMFNIRNNPHSRSDQLEAHLRALIDSHRPGDWSLEWRESGAPFGPATGPLPGAVARACRQHLGQEPQFDTGGGTSDGRFLGPLGIPVVELGPVNRTIHQIDECVRAADLAPLAAVYQAVVEDFLDTTG